MASYSDDDDETGDYHNDYTLEEYDIGPTVQEQEHQDVSNIDFRMDAPPPTRSMENRLRDASEAAPPEGMQLARPDPSCCGGASSHTGPKAVKADYEAAKQVLRNQRMMDRMRRERALEAGVRVDLTQLAMTPAEQARVKKAQEKAANGSDSEEEDEDDDAAFEQYRQQRIAFVQNSLPRFGVHTRVSKGEFATLVKEVHELCYVVCHLYQNNVESCVRLNLIFESLAPQFPHVRFCRLRSTEAMPGFKAAGLPALLVYRGGQMLTQALRVTEVMPKRFGDIDVAKLLQAKGILTVPTGMADNSSRLKDDLLSHSTFSDDENADAEYENQSGPSGFNLVSEFGNTSIGGGSRGGGGIGGRNRNKISIHRAAESGSDSD